MMLSEEEKVASDTHLWSTSRSESGPSSSLKNRMSKKRRRELCSF